MSLGAAIIGAILLNSIVGSLGGDRTQAASLAFGDAGGVHLSAEKSAIRSEATTRGIREAMLVGAGFALAGLVVSNWLPMRAQVRRED